MKSLRDQIADKCIHFNGVMEKICKSGIAYTDVRVEGDGPYKFPCLKQGGQCSSAQFLTPEEVDAKVKSIEDSGLKVTRAIAAIKDHISKTKEQKGKIPCECGGELHYVVSSYNGHVKAACNSCKSSFTE